MIWHFFELWVLLAVAFAAGCILGMFLYRTFAVSALADAQGAVADTVGDMIDGLKARFGVGPAWRPAFGRVRRRVTAIALPVAVAPTVRKPEPADDLPEFLLVSPPEAEDESPPTVLPEIEEEWEPAVEPEWREEEALQLEDLTLEPEEVAEPEIARLDEPPPPEAEAEAAAEEAPMRPMGLPGPRNGVPDDLQRIRGIGRRIEQTLNGLGIYHYGQIAAWTPAEARWVGAYLAFPERIERDDWIAQATILATGGSSGHVKGSDRNKPRDED